MRTKTPVLPEKMLDAAGRLFGTQRFHEVRMEDIAQAAQVSKGTLYRYFRDKEEMYLAILARASHQLVFELKGCVAQAATPRQQLVAIVDAVVRFFDLQPHLFDLIQRAEVRREQGGLFPWQEVRDEGVRLVLDIFARGKRQRDFLIRDPAQAVLMLLGGMRAIVRFGKKPRPRGLARRIVDDFLEGAGTRLAASTRTAGRLRRFPS